MGSEHYCLRWNNHQSNLLGVFSQLLEAESLVDVTLASAEGHSLRAHKVVLSACSSYFQSLFLDHPNRHPIVILKDVHFAELRTLVEFMYRGEVSVETCRLSALLKTAESLKVKGLAEMTALRPTQTSAEEQQATSSTEPETTAEEATPATTAAAAEVQAAEDACSEDDACSVQSGPSDMSLAAHQPPRPPSPQSSGEPLPGPSGLPPVQQVPLVSTYQTLPGSAS
ncbi:hypothetical protein AAG570_005975 [Ranatra chinensis]|uniref:BTB domain-containing protein n=1 Tax=Ranatra chinensis TaxID=642074 RepID=A0ABD0YKD4_9HEMI